MKRFLFILLFFNYKVFAQNILGGELSYRHLNNDVYQVELSMYVDCSNNGFVLQNFLTKKPELKIYNGSALQTITAMNLNSAPGIDANAICPDSIAYTTCSNSSNSIKAITSFTYRSVVNLGGKSNNWRFVFDGKYGTDTAFRATNINNLSTSSCGTSAATVLKLEATLNNTLYDNSSPKALNFPSAFFKINQTQNYNALLLDTIDAFDELEHSLVTALDGGNFGNSNCFVNYTAGYSFLSPIKTTGNFFYNPQSGQMRFTPNVVESGLVCEKVIEKRNGVVIGTMMREMTYFIINSATTANFGINNFSLQNQGTLTNTGIYRKFCANNIPLRRTIFLNLDSAKRTNPNLKYEFVGLVNPDAVIFDTALGQFVNMEARFDLNKRINPFFLIVRESDCPYTNQYVLEFIYELSLNPILDSVITTKASCAANCNGTANVFASSQLNSNLSYALNNGAFTTNSTFTNLCPGVYTLAIQDTAGCTIYRNIIIENTNPVFPLFTAFEATCIGGCDGFLVLNGFNPIGNYNFLYDGLIYNVGDTIKNLCEGTNISKLIFVINTNNCVMSSNFFQVPGQLRPQFNSNYILKNVDCIDSCNGWLSAISTNIPGCTFSLNSGPFQPNNFFLNLCPATYTLTAKAPNGCQSSLVFNIIKQLPQFTNLIVTPTNCKLPNNDGAIQFNVQTLHPPFEVSLNNGPWTTNTNYSNLNNGIYTIVIRDTLGCENTKVVAVSTSPDPFLMTSNIRNMSCYDVIDGQAQVTFAGFPNINYTLLPNNISNGSGTFTSLSTGNYTIQIIDGKQCTASYNFSITRPDSLYFTQVLVTQNYCNTNANGSIITTALGGTLPYSYTLTNNGVLQGAFGGIKTDAKEGTYQVTLKDSKGCEISTLCTIDKYPNSLSFSVQTRDPQCVFDLKNGRIEINPTKGFMPYTYFFDNISSSLNIAENLTNGMYTVAVQDSVGCYEYKEVKLQGLEDCCDLIRFPNAFSPNGDGINEEFGLFNGHLATIKEFKVFDRWGTLVFSSDNDTLKWLGVNQQGKICDVAVYYYYARYICNLTQQEKTAKGEVTLLK